MVKKAIILAAGEGTRLKPLTDKEPKSLTEVNGIPILTNALDNLNKAGIKETVIVIGHLGDRIKTFIGDSFEGMKITYIENPLYYKTNNIYSLWLARDHMNKDTLILEGDIFFEEKILHLLIQENNENAIAIDHFMPLLNGFVVGVDVNGMVNGMYLKENQKPYRDFNYTDKFKTVNVSKFSKSFLEDYYLKELDAFIQRGDVHFFYEKVIKKIFDEHRISIKGVVVKGYRWFEIDNLDELKRAEEVFSW